MRKAFLLTTLFLNTLFAQDQTINNLNNYKNQYQYNLMDSLNEAHKTNDYSFYKAVYYNVTNNPKTSLKYLTTNKNKHLKNTFDYIKLKNDNAIKAFDYKLAYETSKQLITTFKDLLNTNQLNDEINNQRIWEVLINTPKQTISPFKTIELTTKKDLANLITLNVSNKSYTSDFVFDTGAGLNCITETQAKKLDVSILPDNNIEVESFTGQKNNVKIGVAKSLTIGDITIKNAIFLVYPDDAFTFAGGKYVINGIIGFPIAKELGTLTIEENKITVSKEIQPYNGEKNLFIDQLRSIVMVNFKGKNVPCNFDTGASASLFNQSFYEKFKSYIDKNATDKEITTAGAGAKTYTHNIKILANEKFKIGNSAILLPNFSIEYNNYGVYGKENFGNIGQDVLHQFKKITLSFDQNYLLLEN